MTLGLAVNKGLQPLVPLLARRILGLYSGKATSVSLDFSRVLAYTEMIKDIPFSLILLKLNS